MKTIKNTVKTELMYDDTEKRRYLLHIEWDKEKPKACVIMLSAGATNGISFDHTTNYVLQNLVDLDYGSVDIVNLFSTVDSKTEAEEDNENLNVISSSAKKADIVVFATGTSYKTNIKVKTRQKAVLESLETYKEKLYCLADEDGQKFYHPLCPKVRKWNLEKFDIEGLLEECADD